MKTKRKEATDMNITVTRREINKIYDEPSFKNELTEFLNAVIDEEIEKGDNMDTELIDECIGALDELQNAQSITPALRLVLTEKQIIKYCKRNAGVSQNHTKAAVAACLIIILSGITILQTNPALAQQAKDFFGNIISALGIAAEQSETNLSSDISSIYAVYPDNASFKVKRESEINLDNVKIKAVYKDSSEKEIELNDCTVNMVKNTENNTVLVVIAYGGCALSVTYTIEE